ncbi:unnamed protein product [Blepharisma stoltei]|uniref:RRM domain-containing protein n=1 Tax=Blepharisma stoltei TaxID=1481888 RepID=A0AAU9IJZ6_9CILI|nr:unnamed protein product [Blepharisma stoltei]
MFIKCFRRSLFKASNFRYLSISTRSLKDIISSRSSKAGPILDIDSFKFDTDDPRKLEPKSREIFIGNLDWNTTEAEVQNLLKGYGQITRIIMHKDDKGRMMGACFVQFSKETEALYCLSLNDKELNGRRLKVNLTCDEKVKDQWRNFKIDKTKRTIFINDVIQSYILSKELEQSLEQFGKLIKMTYPTSSGGVTLGYAFAEFETYQQAEKALKQGKVTIRGKDLKIQKTFKDMTNRQLEMDMGKIKT